MPNIKPNLPLRYRDSDSNNKLDLSALSAEINAASDQMALRGSRYPDQSRDVMFNPVGQIVGSMNKVRSSRELIGDLVSEYADAVERLNALGAE